MVEIKSEENNTVQLPNNIRQVGTPGEKMEIYIEDYGMTYLRNLLFKKQHFFLVKRSKRRVRIFTLSVRQLL